MTPVRLALGGLERLNRVTLGGCAVLTVLLVAAMAVVVCAGVWWRYVLNNALAWSEETAKFLMVWLVFVGAPIALRQGGHAAIDVLPNLLAPRLRHALYTVVHGIVLGLMAVLVYQGGQFAWNGRTQITATTSVSMLYVFGAIPVGGTVMFFVALELMLRAAVDALRPATAVEAQEVEKAHVVP